MGWRKALTLSFVITALLAATTCGGGSKRAVVQGFSPGSSAGDKTSPEGLPAEAGLDYQAANDISLDETITELERMECPGGVDEALWVELKDALEEALKNRAFSVGAIHELPSGEKAGRGDPALHCDLTTNNKQPTTARFASTPPTGEANRVNDLSITDNGDGTFTLNWHYRNLGDYDQNGVVGIEDITPLAQHFGEDVAPENEWIDGDFDGRVHISDITPIAMNFAVDVHHYVIEGAEDEAGTYELVSEVAQDAGSGEGRLEYSAIIESPAALWHRVVPVDSEGNPGEASNVVLRPSNEPIIYEVTPTEGYQHEEYTFSATVSGAEPLSYAWDFGGGAIPDTSSDPSPTVTLTDAGVYAAFLTVTNAYGNAIYPFTLTVSERDMWAHTWGTSNQESCRALIIGPDGDLFLAATGEGALVLRVDNLGNFIWARKWTGDEGASAGDIAFDTDGNLIVAGGTRSFGEGRSDLLLLKYSVDGELMRAMTWGTGDYEYHSQISVDEAGNIYLCGRWVVYGGDPLALVMKLDPDWNVLWAKRWGGTGDDRAYGILSHEGAVYVCGKTGSFGAPECDALLMKMSPDGEVLWARTWGTEREDSANEMAISPDGCIYIVGESDKSDPDESAGLILMYAANGDFLSARSREISPWDSFRDVCFDTEGNLVVIGKVEGNIVLIVFSPDLSIISCMEWHGSYIRSEGRSCGFDDEGYLYIAGESRDPEGSWLQTASEDFIPESLNAAVEGDVWDLEGVAHAPEGTVTSPEGVLDTGGGDDDILLLKYFPR